LQYIPHKSWCTIITAKAGPGKQMSKGFCFFFSKKKSFLYFLVMNSWRSRRTPSHGNYWPLAEGTDFFFEKKGKKFCLFAHAAWTAATGKWYH
jgi:hypothetical protein